LTTFKDHFSGHAAAYAAHRPHYPAELIAWVVGLPPRHEVAWDVATGNGQAAVALAPSFARVVATDASVQQLAEAMPHPRIEYRLGTAEHSELADGSVDLVTVAQALHWFDFDRFYAEVRRVLAPGGAIAAWSYNFARVTPGVDHEVDRLRDIVVSYWPPERRWVDDDYRTIPFAFAEIEAPVFRHSEEWSLDRLIAYLRTWSACQRYLRETGKDAVAVVADDLARAWGDARGSRTVNWPIHLRAGFVQR
jgi:ubiquinone/menaquinone biosynthesis C-methylase UbiE